MCPRRPVVMNVLYFAGHAPRSSFCYMKVLLRPALGFVEVFGIGHDTVKAGKINFY